MRESVSVITQCGLRAFCIFSFRVTYCPCFIGDTDKVTGAEPEAHRAPLIESLCGVVKLMRLGKQHVQFGAEESVGHQAAA